MGIWKFIVIILIATLPCAAATVVVGSQDNDCFQAKLDDKGSVQVQAQARETRDDCPPKVQAIEGLKIKLLDYDESAWLKPEAKIGADFTQQCLNSKDSPDACFEALCKKEGGAFCDDKSHGASLARLSYQDQYGGTWVAVLQARVVDSASGPASLAFAHEHVLLLQSLSISNDENGHFSASAYQPSVRPDLLQPAVFDETNGRASYQTVSCRECSKNSDCGGNYCVNGCCDESSPHCGGRACTRNSECGGNYCYGGYCCN